MTDYREILRLRGLQYSQRAIARSVRCSRNTVEKVLSVSVQLHLAWPLSDDITNAELEQLLFPNKHKASSQYAEPDYPYIHRELARSGVTLTLLWEEYCAKCQEAGQRPYMSTQFGERYRRWARITKATMRIQHKPGGRHAGRLGRRYHSHPGPGYRGTKRSPTCCHCQSVRLNRPSGRLPRSPTTILLRMAGTSILFPTT